MYRLASVGFFLTVFAGPAKAQTVAYESDLDCLNAPAVGDETSVTGWSNIYGSDKWEMDANDGVSPFRDDSAGDYGGSADGYENFLLTGHPLQNDQAIEADISNSDDDAHGLVARYSDINHYYVCWNTNHWLPDCNGGGAASTDGVYLMRVDTGQSCATDDYIKAQDNTFTRGNGIYRTRLEVIGNTVTCTVDADQNGIGTGTDVVLTYVDPAPLPAGRMGLAAYDNGGGGGKLEFDDIVVYNYDTDTDGDGLSDVIEASIGTDPLLADTDGDGISDRVEATPQFPAPDTDGDFVIDALDTDSDDDGIPDEFEAGGDPPIDTDCGSDGLADYRDTDSDDDGVLDGADNCRVINNDQTDTDGDGLGNPCDPDSGNADIDGDGLTDGEEVNTYFTDPTVADSDGDGLNDGDEVNVHGTDPAQADTDGDTLTDGDEINTWGTNPTLSDTDGGGTDDGTEINIDGTNPLVAGDDIDSSDDDNDGYCENGVDLNGDGDCTDAGEPDPIVRDCNDGNAAISPGDPELCSTVGVDDNCDGSVDENTAADVPTWYADTDGDTFGDQLAPLDSCTQPAGHVANLTDCDDTKFSVRPNAPELCSTPDDDNCDGSVNEATAADAATWFDDSDVDGFGSPASATPSCTQPGPTFILTGGDCNDSNPAISPGDPELCSTVGIDDNCSGVADEATATDATTWYLDNDTDSYGTNSTTQNACTAPPGYVATGGDCNDGAININPGADELCATAGIDDNCNGQTDEPAATDTTTFYADADGDSYGNASSTQNACNSPVGYVADNTDCNDLSGLVNPGATEVCNGLDDDCDTLVDDASAADATTWFADTDMDGHGDIASSQVACSAPPNHVANSTDCDDGNADISPSDPERCSTVGVDDDCDTQIDEASAIDAGTWFHDGDTDTYGDPGDTQKACTAPATYVADNTDCDDSQINVNPGATELCSTVGVDDDCDGQTDESDAPDVATFYRDSDGDNFGDNATTTAACSAPVGFVGDNTDCDDTNLLTYPGANEICDGEDNDCDGPVDEGTSVLNWFLDSDGDSFGDASNTQSSCAQPAGYVSNGADCDDGNAAINPGAAELCSTVGIDDNCNLQADEPTATDAGTFYRDADVDGYGNPASTTPGCVAPGGYVADNTDCDDTRFGVNPGANELCSTVGIDDDCDTQIDENDAFDVPTWYADTDTDNYGDNADSLQQCTQPAGYIADNTDCDDTNSNINPGALERCVTAGVDDDCDTLIDENDAGDVLTWFADTDTDTYGNPASTTQACTQPGGFVANGLDCNDTDTNINPGALELCATVGVDDDCDSQIDESDADDVPTWYRDGDADSFGRNSQTLVQCSQPAGFVAANGDCDDTNNTVFPGNPEVCDDLDNDCNTLIDDTLATSNWYRDADGDSFGDTTVNLADCAQPSGYVADNTDCNDNNGTVNPSATEVCDGVDNNCDGSVDEGTLTTYYADTDGDTFGDPANSTDACAKPAGFLLDNTDCDDTNIFVNPGANERCATVGVDDDCDTQVDEPSAIDVPTWYADTDTDIYGDAGSSLKQCTQPAGFVASNTDCDDTNINVNPGALELCATFGVDDDCDTLVDENDADDVPTWYRDNDNDNYGVTGQTQVQCAKPAGFAAADGDCLDTDNSVFPGAPELCDNLDNDCNTLIDDSVATTTWYRDSDGDTFGDPNNSVDDCAQPSGYVADDTDCDDNNGTINPLGDEVCDNVDNDCNSVIDDGVGTTYFADTDGDNFGDAGNSTVACTKPAGFLLDDTDCDDSDPNVNPGELELCSTVGVDDNCNGADDEPTADDAPTWYADTDTDTFGDVGAPQVRCTQPAGHVANNGDCDDTNPNINPGALELCATVGVDDDCDTLIDENDANDVPTWYRDNDADTYGVTSQTQVQCAQPAGFAAIDGDCLDTDNTVYPTAPELCDNLDNDCNTLIDDGVGTFTWYRDSDGDTFGDLNTTVDDCAQPSGYVADNTDCNDNNGTINPNGTEVCDSVDNDCDTVIDDGVGNPYYADTDSDGFGDAGTSAVACSPPPGFVTDDTDCDDTRPSIWPGAPELCDGFDNDCDTLIDNGTSSLTWYADTDGDTYGDLNVTFASCSKPAGFVLDDTDCDDADPNTHPDAPEVCDSKDNDCDDFVDEGASATVWYFDGDNDGFGDPGDGLTSCTPLPSRVLDNTDCNDGNPNIHPTAPEACNNIDDDCDTTVDEGVAFQDWFADADKDGFGDAGNVLNDCVQPAGFVADSNDCDDANPFSYPTAPELCDGEDNDCDTLIDNGASTGTYYADADGDGFGDAGDSLDTCSPPPGYVANDTDCDDGAPAVYPGAVEQCDGIDNDCDTLIDDGAPIRTWYADTDGDGFGDDLSTTDACIQPPGHVLEGNDCDDTRGNVFPFAAETCDGLDNDCDTLVDEGGVLDWYRDVDGDSYGDAGDTTQSCAQPAGYVLDDTDCDDAVATTFPGAPELCNSVDDDCDTSVDENLTVVTWYADSDGDSFGDAAVTFDSCTQPAGFVADDTDCDDTEPLTNPNGVEVCDNEDNDCDTQVDEGATNQTWYADNDNDGFGNSADGQVSCDPLPGRVLDDTDCNDLNGAINPGAAEACNGIDDDCDTFVDNGTAFTDWFADADGDGFGDAGDLLNDCQQPFGYVADSNDCDDTNPFTYPAAPELCDSEDNDCNTLIDDNASTGTFFADSDGDGFGDPGDSVTACTPPPGFVADDTDCDDTAADVFPGAPEICDNIDNDCDTLIDDGASIRDWHADTDADGFGDAGDTLSACNQPLGYVLDDQDCDDSASNVFPGAPELCDGVDNDCNTLVDDNAGVVSWFRDADNDGYGDAGDTVQDCNQPPGYLLDDSDCDDTNGAVFPFAPELCNGVDDDCDGTADDGVSSVTWYADTDGDNFGDLAVPFDSCTQPAGFVLDNTDCDDTTPFTNPNGVEVCDNKDNDCDTFVDEGASSQIWYLDADNDLFGNPADGVASCDPLPGRVLDDTDCNDNNITINPLAAEACNGLDDNCNTFVDDGVVFQDWWADADGDGFGDPGDLQNDCQQPFGYVNDANDCDDTSPFVYPAAPELCDSIDNDCNTLIDDGAGQGTFYGDADGDGFGDAGNSVTACTAPAGFVGNDTDCADGDAQTYPGAPELCDGIDNDCDTLVDDGASVRDWYADTDGDSFGNASDTVSACNQPPGYVLDDNDCDDTSAAVYPFAPELCDTVDNDCNTLIDDGVAPLDWYADTDFDGYGDAGDSISNCLQPPGYILDDNDCDDTNPAIFPLAPELCNGIDDDCDGTADDGTVSATWYADTDNDGFGDANTSFDSCTQPAGFVLDDTDCDDTEPLTNPNGVEVCDNEDNDCDTQVDEGATNQTWYADTDNDGFGNSADGQVSCNPLPGRVLDDTDCNDLNGAINPGAAEACNGLDDDCDTFVDNGVVFTDWYADADKDGFGDPGNLVNDCVMPFGYVADSNDCDDTNPNTFPSAPELCDSEDNDCNTLIDDNASTGTFYRDDDGDGYGDASDTVDSCTAPVGYVNTGTDCDDTDPNTWPGAVELCDGADNDCDTLVDDGVSTPDWYADTDGDGFGDPLDSIASCNALPGRTQTAGDCDDGDAAAYPLAPELCDGIDNDCDSNVDDGVTNVNWYVDADFDGYGDASTAVLDCQAPGAGYIQDGTDCDDTASTVFPGAPERCNGIDDDCDTVADNGTSLATWYADSDNDGFGDVAVSFDSCSQPAGFVLDDTDCDDTTPFSNPNGVEVCDNKDNDCDTFVDEGASDQIWYLDGDNDGFGNAADGVTSCAPIPGRVLDDTDCNDGNITVNPLAAEACNGIDDNCNTFIDDAVAYTDYYADADGDGFGDASARINDCKQPVGYVLDDNDCDDNNPFTYPAAFELCDGLDNDCDTVADNNASTGTFYRDVDGDGYGDSADTNTGCTPPAGYVGDGTDCDDNDLNTYPGAPELCDGLDNDCDTFSDEGVSSPTWYADNDGDGFGDLFDGIDSCSALVGRTQTAGDCDDGDNSVYPNANELCDGIDNDCNFFVDDGTAFLDWHPDADGDGFGDPGSLINDCAQPTGTVLDDTDCDDTLNTVYPGAPERCNGVDDDCDGTADDGVSIVTWYIDSDGDNFGDPNITFDSCSQPAGFVIDNTDCDDSNPLTNPNGVEVCDNEDNDCDSSIDDGATDQAWYADSDNDGYGNSADAQISCAPLPGRVLDGTDCNDLNTNINPGASEACNGLDDDCNTFVDDAVVFSDWYADSDDDGFGDQNAVLNDCQQPFGYVADDTDCDDTSPYVYPAAPELCDGLDNDCDGTADDGAGNGTFYADADGDGFGDPNDSVSDCTPPLGYVADGTDCDDASAFVYPDAPELCDGIDNDCDTLVDDGVVTPDWYPDADNDGFGDPSFPVASCSSVAGHVLDSGDCDDADPTSYPLAPELCDGIDNDCDAAVDESVVYLDWYNDADNDGFGDPATGTNDCAQPPGTVLDGTDCDDTAGAVFPFAPELCNLIDDDCDGTVDDNVASATWYADTDADGFGDATVSFDACTQPAGFVLDDTDCDDANPFTHPNGIEVCDNEDNDCDGFVDEGATSVTWYADNDNDGYGDAADGQVSCVPLPGRVLDDTDCNDLNQFINPGEAEQCNGLDDNCNSFVDDGVSFTPWFADADSDGFGDASALVTDCKKPFGYVADANDCDDTNPFSFPLADELCDGFDNDCDGTVDDNATSGTFYADADGDGFGNVNDSVSGCTPPPGYVGDATDCDDTDALTWPGAVELCDSIDNDCDTVVDDGAAPRTWYADTDDDSFGDPGSSIDSCSPVPGHVLNDGDCDDSSDRTYPFAPELCDSVDNDCDTFVDDNIQTLTWYRDVDDDGFGDPAVSTTDCNPPLDFVLDGSDCDDAVDSTFPLAPELCDSIDNDCDGTADDNVLYVDWYADADSDGFGDPSVMVNDCTRPAGYVSDANDCDDSTSFTYPAAAEVCDSADNDCDGTVDEDTVNVDWYPDADGDNFGESGATPINACVPPADHVLDDNDCNDADRDIRPGGFELCDGIDNDCDGLVDDGAGDGQIWYDDDDGDGYGDATDSVVACAEPIGHVMDGTDCDDTNDLSNPGGVEFCDGEDNDCNGTADDGAGPQDWYADADGDGFGDPNTTINDCNRPFGYVLDNTDCDDGTDRTWPGAPELCDGADNDCNTVVDDSITYFDWFADTDGDGHGDGNDVLISCDQPAGYVTSDADCDDTDGSIHPNAVELCDAVDNDCDSVVDDNVVTIAWYADLDGDAFGDPTTSIVDCAQPAGYVPDGNDCDDSTAFTYPGAPELCDNADNDCDGVTDDNVVNLDWYPDADQDGYGDPTATTNNCQQPSGFVLDAGDCNDADQNIHPDASEVCNGVDDDCNFFVDDNATDATVWYADTDEDGFGDAADSVLTCAAPFQHVANANDCDDANPFSNPAAVELCDLEDNDCDGVVDNDVGVYDWYTDADGDGYGDASTQVADCNQPAADAVLRDGDCDDADIATRPGAPELCDNIDNDCDGTADDGVANLPWYLDQDGDGFGDPNTTLMDCSQPANFVSNDHDCDDLSAAFAPGQPELCNGLDDDCDGVVDDNLNNALWYVDSDMDGYGDTNNAVFTCLQPVGTVSAPGDCDDTYFYTHPDAVELCDLADNDCDTNIDENVQTLNWYTDQDSDGFGDPVGAIADCDVVAGRVHQTGDCDDSDTAVNPNADEVCDGVDNDCEGTVDQFAIDGAWWYADDDGDGFGDPNDGVHVCDAPLEHVSDDTDCDDADEYTNPAAAEQCDTLDNDCNGTIDDNTVNQDWYQDADRDGYGNDSTVVNDCRAPGADYVLTGGDCDDQDDFANPGMTEICDAADNDCNGVADNNVVDQTWYADSDGDGWGDDAVTVTDCAPPAGYVGRGGDCNDLGAATHPTAPEQCDGLDNDCDQVVDDNLIDTTWYIDVDGDGVGTSTATIEDCLQPTDYVAVEGDCDDTDDMTYPGAAELCDNLDNDCDGFVDENVLEVNWYADNDGDGYGDPADSVRSCDQPTDFVGNDEDCDDRNFQVNPDEVEQPYNGLDDDCVDGDLVDVDGDGFDGIDADGEDCDDEDETVFPGAEEVPGDDIDQDCDGEDAVPEDPDAKLVFRGGTCACSANPTPMVPWLLLGLLGVVVRRR